MEDWFERIHPEDSTDLKHILGEHLTSNSTFKINYRIKTKAGSYKIIQAKGKCKKDEQNIPVYISGSITDINEQEKLKAEIEVKKQDLQKANLRYELALEGASTGIWEWEDDDGRDMFWSKKFIELLGYNYNEITPTIDSFYQLVHPEEQEYSNEILTRFIKTGTTLDTTFRLKTTRGFEWFRCTAALTRNEDLRATKVVGSIQNIHQQKEAEAQLRIEKTRLLIALDSGNMGVSEWNVTDDELSWDKRMFSIFGLKEQKTLCYKDWKKTVLIEDIEKTESTFHNSLKSRSRQSMSYRINHPTKGIRHIQEAHIPVFNKENKLTWVIGVNQDVTEEVKSQKKLAEANKKLEQFVFTISHDLKAPLVTIKSFSELLLQTDNLKEKSLHWITRIKENSEHLEHLLDELLMLSRIMHKELEFERVNILDIISKVKNSILVTIEKNNTELILPKNDFFIDCHPKLIQQVFTNIISNSIKYKKENIAPIIEIEIEDKNDSIEIAIHDNGKGIDQAHQKRVFQIFERINPEDKNVKGTGVGLSIVQSVIEKHNGSIWIKDNHLEGTTFKFALPKINNEKK